MKPAAIARRDGVHQHYRQIRAYSCAAFFVQRPVEPPPKRSLCSKNAFALKGSPPAGVATPVRTDRAIMANTVVFMASSYEEYRVTARRRKRAPCKRDRRRGEPSTLENQLELALHVIISALHPICAQLPYLGTFVDGALEDVRLSTTHRRRTYVFPTRTSHAAWRNAVEFVAGSAVTWKSR